VVDRGEVLPYRATAEHEGRVLADSTATRRVDHPDAAPDLWFPLADVVRDLPDGDLWRSGDEELAGHVAFEHDWVDVTILDAREGDDERDMTTKRFPTWGDATDLIRLLDVQPVDERIYRSPGRGDWRRPVVEGSQLLGEAIVAVSREVPDRRAVSAWMCFTRPADAREEHDLVLEQVASGRTFSTFEVRAMQAGRTCAAGMVLSDVTAADVIRHAEPMPAVVGPYESMPFDMSVTGRDLRIVAAAYTGDPDAPVGPPELDAWVRFRDVPDDPPIHAGLLAQFTGHLAIAAALRPHPGIGQDQAHVTLSTAINAISISLHADVRVDRWLLYHHRSTFAGDGMTHAECRVHEEDGALVASFTVDAMVRAFDDPTRGDARTAL
jgi:acyl-CoA thioesterase